MNTGIGDAINLAWKLATAVAGRAGDSLLDTYEAERIGFARRLVATTDRIFSFATAEGRIADILRTRVAPMLIPRAAAFNAVREFMFRTVSQIMLNLSRGCSEPWRGRSCARRRSAAMGAGRWRRQFCAARHNGLASPCLWLSQRRARSMVHRS